MTNIKRMLKKMNTFDLVAIIGLLGILTILTICFYLLAKAIEANTNEMREYENKFSTEQIVLDSTFVALGETGKPLKTVLPLEIKDGDEWVKGKLDNVPYYYGVQSCRYFTMKPKTNGIRAAINPGSPEVTITVPPHPNGAINVCVEGNQTVDIVL